MNNNNENLTDQLARAINQSRLILCCINSVYVGLINCKSEFAYSLNIKKKMILLFIDDFKPADIGAVRFSGVNLDRIDCFKNPDTWNDKVFIYDKIKPIVDKILEVSY